MKANALCAAGKHVKVSKEAYRCQKRPTGKMKAHALCAVPSYFYYIPYSKLYAETV
jgi:hypothetical protein